MGIGYVEATGGEEDFWAKASRHVPFWPTPLSIEDVNTALGDWKDWSDLRAKLQFDDKILPFAFNVDTSAMRAGYVVLRQGKPVGGVVAVLS